MSYTEQLHPEYILNDMLLMAKSILDNHVFVSHDRRKYCRFCELPIPTQHKEDCPVLVAEYYVREMGEPIE